MKNEYKNFDVRKLNVYAEDNSLIDVGIVYDSITLLDELELFKNDRVEIIKATKEDIEKDIL